MKIRQAVPLAMLAFVIQACASTTQGPYTKATTNRSLLTPPHVSEAAAPAESTNEEEPKAAPKRPPLPSLTGTIQTGLLGFTSQTKAPKTTFPERDRQKISFLFEKVDVAEVTSQIFGDYLKLNYVLDPTLQGRISFYLEGEFSKEDLFQMITRAYAANNISVVARNGVYYIQPLQRSASSSLPLASEFTLKTAANGAQPVIVIYRLLFLDVKQAVNTIKFFLTPGRPITSDSMTNSVIFVDDTDNARTIVDILKSLDINILQEVSMEIIPLQAITAQDAVQGMESLLGKLNLVKESSIKNNIAFIPLQNFGGVLVLAQSAELLKTAKYWLTALDVHSQESGEQIYVYFVKNGLAVDLAGILTQSYGLEAPSGAGRLDQQIVQSGRPFGSSSSRSSFGSGSSGFGGSSFGGSTSRSGYGTSGSSLSGGGFGGSSSSMGTTGGSLSSGTSSQSRQGARGGSVRTGGAYTRVSNGDATGTSLTGEVAIIPDEVNNAIVVRSNAADYARIKKTMETLDILPRAVLIEVLIAEVALNKNIEYGLEWFFKDIGMDIGGKGGKFTAAHGTADGSALTGAASGGLSLFWGSVDGKIAALINLLASKTDVNVLSTPTLLATDNKEASIQVGGREPVPTGSYSSDTNTNNAFTTIQYEETGIILNVVPHINEGGLVRLEVEQTIRRTDQQSVTVGANNTAPRFTERNVKTTLLAQNGSTVVIGGIIEQTDSDQKSGIPLLQDIPVISPLFSSKGKKKIRTELIIAITPHVVDHRETGGSSREFLEQLKKLRKHVEG
ncbi:type II secretion system secretin GspD [Desulforhabdus sp. TSK]|uniref:type II secretion system secretin GspD n=1 Tax=Desulforhabdus sp. TSK TaxID=2925014 RepID=UPI001FC7FF24|nr:type II secretion system secretin GspD [Desulforhabdus sp. TSK]GKT07044.1 hypothetical protein DSTSK_03490 [Desulforhabdus sp. TSK]